MYVSQAASPAALSAGAGASSPTVLPWIDYGASAAGGGSFGWGGGLKTEPPWSDALAGPAPCSCQSGGGLLAWIQAHPWLALALAAVAVALVAGVDSE